MKMKRLCMALAAAGALSAPMAHADSCCEPTGNDFPSVGGNPGNQRYSALAQIHKGNIRQLGGAWLNKLEGGSTTSQNPATAIAVDGVLYVETGQGNLHAVNGKTGVKKWSYARGTTTQRRGVAVGQGNVYTVGANNSIIALNKDTGALVWQRSYTGVGNVAKVAVTYHNGRVYMGTNDGNRGAALMIDGTTGELLSSFFGAPGPGELGNDTWEGNSWQTGGATPWQAPAIDPDLGLIYWTFGNARSGGALDGSTRGGANLFANSIVALDLNTGAYRWHFQSVHHDIWDMDNVMTPLLVDFTSGGKPRKAVVYGSKTAMHYILDRATGEALVPIEERPVPQEPSQKTWPTQPFSGDPLVPLCATPDGDSRPVPNYEVGCLFTPHTDKAVIKSPGTGGGNDWAGLAYSPRTKLFYSGYGLINTAQSIPTGGVGFRPLGQNRGGGLVAKNPVTNRIVWKKDLGWSLTHGAHILATASDLLFVGQPDGNLLGLDAVSGKEVFRFQTGASINSGAITYMVDGEQYVAVFSGGNGLPYGDSVRGDFLWAFKLGGSVPQAVAPTPPSKRQPITADAVDGSVVNNVVTLARVWNNNAVGNAESDAQNAMAPQHLRVPVGATVRFLNPAGNTKPHCATQFFEGLFNVTLNPGQSYDHTFTTPGEYFYNDCASPRTTGKVVVYAPVVRAPGAPVKKSDK